MRRLAQAVLAAAVVAAVHPAAAASIALFGTAESRVDSLIDLPQWQRVMRRADAEAGLVRACAEAPARCPNRATRSWTELLHRLAGRPPRVQVEAVHRFVNARAYRPDAENYGRSDYWATPLEFFRRSGDCEDYVIAKYRSLRLLGFAPAQLRMVVVQDTVRDLPHAVLAVYLDGEALILDNLSPAVIAQDRVDHYVPYYSVNEEARWVHGPPATAVSAVAWGAVQPARP